MPSEIAYGTLANYSPRGKSPVSQKSRSICGGIKAGKENVIRSAFPHLRGSAAAILQPFLDPDVILVPIPRSAPLADGALWPARVIADLLIAGGFGAEVLPCLERTRAVPKSASSPASGRPLWTDHYETIEVRADLLSPTALTLVDDVLTMGRTTYACAKRIREAFPDAEIRVFSMIRTQGLIPDIAEIVDPAVGTIIGYPSGKTRRDP